ncbi:hypothetical protein KSF73_01510 [Burkholderiaceae bacterium DAT-1]|nr:hypothetical protein [Burkholderiaceae bacterium DAT-1]
MMHPSPTLPLKVVRQADGTLNDEAISTLIQCSDTWILICEADAQLSDTPVLAECPQDLLYLDEMVFGRHAQLHQFHSKSPTLNLPYLLGFNYIGADAFIRMEALRAWGIEHCRQVGWLYAFALYLVRQKGEHAIAHSGMTLHTTGLWLSKDDNPAGHIQLHAEQQALSETFGALIAAKPHPELNWMRSISTPNQFNGLITIIIPMIVDLAELQACLNNLIEHTSWDPCEILLVYQAGRISPDLAAYFDVLRAHPDAGIRLFESQHHPQSAQALDAAIRMSEGERIFVSHPGNLVSDEDWLQQLSATLDTFQAPAAAPLILNQSGAVARSTGILGLSGLIGELCGGDYFNQAAAFGRLAVTQYASTLSLDATLLAKDAYLSTGGLNPRLSGRLMAADLCLQLNRQGRPSCFVPQLMFKRTGSHSIGADESVFGEKLSQEERWFYKHWRDALNKDPFQGLAFSRQGNGTQIETRPLVLKQSAKPNIPAILAYPNGTTGVGMYRVIQPATALDDQGLATSIISHDELVPADFAAFRPDSILLQYRPTPHARGFFRRTRFYGNTFMIFEIDDDPFSLPSYNCAARSLKHDRDFKQRMRYTMQSCDRLVVSTSALAEILAEHHDNIVIAPNYLPLSWLDLPRAYLPRKNDKPRVGWAGAGSHDGDLKILNALMKHFGESIDWVLLGGATPKQSKLACEFYPFTNFHHYPSLLASLDLDLALAPLLDNRFNQSKSNLRQLELGVCGYPMICSDVRPYRESGLPVTLAKYTASEWIDAMEHLLSDRDQLKRSGEALRETISQHWMLRGEALQSILSAWLPE